MSSLGTSVIGLDDDVSDALGENTVETSVGGLGENGAGTLTSVGILALVDKRGLLLCEGFARTSGQQNPLTSFVRSQTNVDV